MAVQRTRVNVAYGLSDNLLALAQLPIIAKRDPGSRDLAQLGCMWINTVAGTAWTLVSISANVATWSPAPIAGATTLASLIVNPGNATVTAGNLAVTAGNLTVGGTSLLTGNVTMGGDLGVNGNASLSGTLGVSGTSTFGSAVTINSDLAVTGNVTITGDFDITDTSSISITSTNNAAGAITLLTNGGAAETLIVRSAQGTAANALQLTASVGGVTMTGGLATADAINIVASNAGGGIDIDAGTAGIAVDTTGAFSIDGAAASNVTVTGAGIDLLLSSVGGSVLVESTENAALAIRLHANGGTSETIQLHADQGTGVGSINLLSDVGGLTFRSTGLASADAINLEAAAGGIDMDSALQTNIASSQAAVANAIRIVASAADGGMDIDAGTGGITIDSTGAFSIDGAAASNVTTTGAGVDLTLSSVLGSVLVSSTEDAALAIYLHANGGTSETVDIHADQGTGVASVNIHSDVGGVTMTGGLATADAINLVASNAAGGIDIDAGTAGITIDTTGALSLDSAAASNFTVTGAFDLSLISTLGSVVISGSEVAADAIQLTTAATGGITVNASSAAMLVNRAVNVSAAAGINAFTSTSLTTGVAGIFTSSAATVDAIQTVGGGIKVATVSSASGASPRTVSARHGQAIFSDVIANGAYGTLVITNTLCTVNSLILANASCTTANSAVQIVEITPTASTITLRIFNAGAASTAADILVNFWLMSN